MSMYAANESFFVVDGVDRGLARLEGRDVVEVVEVVEEGVEEAVEGVGRVEVGVGVRVERRRERERRGNRVSRETNMRGR